MNKRLIISGLCILLASPALASADSIQMLPPTPISSAAVCQSGLNQILSYSGAANNGGQSGINCVPIITDELGNMAATGFVQVGNTWMDCIPALAGAIRFNTLLATFEGCNGSSWQAIGGGNSAVGKLYWDGDWSGDNYWCDAGYHVVGFHYNCGCGCLDNATWFECQAD